MGPSGRLVGPPDRREESWVDQCRDGLRDREAEGTCAGKVHPRWVVCIGLLTAKEGNTTRCSCTYLLIPPFVVEQIRVVLPPFVLGRIRVVPPPFVRGQEPESKVRQRSYTMSFAGGGTAGAALEGGEEEKGEGT